MDIIHKATLAILVCITWQYFGYKYLFNTEVQTDFSKLFLAIFTPGTQAINQSENSIRNIQYLTQNKQAENLYYDQPM